MDPLAFPAYDFALRTDGGKRQILDTVRRKWVRLTPEEWVRQHLLRHLADLGYPTGLTAVEKGFDYLGSTWRADVVVVDRQQRPLLIAECKASSVPIDQATFDQLARYNTVVRAHALLATNGLTHYCCVLGEDGYAFLEAIPSFSDLTAA